MARLNIEDSLFKDPRFMRLCIHMGCQYKALGALVLAWTLAQKWYKTPEKMIPKSEWESHGFPLGIIECGLAEVVGEKVRMKGSDEQFNWLAQRIEAGRKGGLKSKGNSASDRQANASKRKPPTLTPTLSLSLSPTQALSQKQNTPKKQKSAVADVCPFDLESVYQKYPRKEGKLPGMRSLAKQIKSQSDFDSFARAVENYAKATVGRDTEHIKMFSSFVGSERSDYPWREWVDYQPRAANKAQAQSDGNVDALKAYLEKIGAT